MKRRLPFSGSVDGDHDGSERRSSCRFENRTPAVSFASHKLDKDRKIHLNSLHQARFLKENSEFSASLVFTPRMQKLLQIPLRSSRFSFVISFDIPAPKCSSCKQGVPSARTNGCSFGCSSLWSSVRQSRKKCRKAMRVRAS